MLVLLSSCANLPDVPACIQLDIHRGYCFNTVSDKEFAVNDNADNPLGKSWWEAKDVMIYLPYESWVEIKSFIIKKCRQHKGCGSHWDKQIKAVDKKLNRP